MTAGARSPYSAHSAGSSLGVIDDQSTTYIPEILVQLLYFDGCPNYRPLETRVRRLLDQSARGADLKQLRVGSDDAAIEQRFIGSRRQRCRRRASPGPETTTALSCRLDATAEGLVGTPRMTGSRRLSSADCRSSGNRILRHSRIGWPAPTTATPYLCGKRGGPTGSR